MDLDENTAKKMLCYLSFTAFLLILPSLTGDILWAIKANIALPKFTHYFARCYMPLICAMLVLIPKTHSRWRKLFHWKIWVPILCILIVFSLSQWRFNSVLNFKTDMLGYSWQWCAILTWTSLSSIQLFLYRHIEIIDGFSLSLYGTYLASIIYEIPSHIAVGQLNFPALPVVIATTFLILYRYHWRPGKLFVFTIIPILMLWTFYFDIPRTLFWLPRLATIPLFTLLPSGLKKTKVESTVQTINDTHF